MTIGGGIAIVLAYVLVSMGVIVAFLWAAFMIGCSSGAGASVVANIAENLLGAAMGDDLPPSQWANKHPKLARLFTAVTLLVVAAVSLAGWGFLVWLIWRVI